MLRLSGLAPIAALAALLGAGQAAGQPQIQSLSAFDVARANGPAETIALCDLTAFLLMRPNLDADVIYAPQLPHRARFWEPLRYPYFRPTSIAVDDKVRGAAVRLESAGVITRTQVAEARARYDADMFKSYRRESASDRLFLEHQGKTCDGLMNDYLHSSIAELRDRYGRG